MDWKRLHYNIALIGFMGTGKSIIAQKLKSLYQMEILEMDQVIEEREQMNISEIFSEKGEEYFRNLETELLLETQCKANVIISCGGGVAMKDENVEAIRKNGKIVLLTATPDTIYNRVKGHMDRPLLNGNMNVEYIEQLMEKRREKYEQAADIIVSTDEKTIEQICEEIVSKLEAKEER